MGCREIVKRDGRESVCVCERECVCAFCVCVCVFERERERAFKVGGEKKKGMN